MTPTATDPVEATPTAAAVIASSAAAPDGRFGLVGVVSGWCGPLEFALLTAR